MRKRAKAHILLACTLSLVSGCTLTISPDTLLRDIHIPENATIFAVPEGYQVTRHILPLDGLGNVHILRLDHPDSEDVHLYSGGRSFRTSRPTNRALRLAALTQADLIFYDYPGRHGTTVAKTADALAAFAPAYVQALETQGWLGDGLIIAHGYSFGGVMAAAMAATRPMDGLILENVSDDIAGVTRAGIPAPIRAFLRIRVNEDIANFPYQRNILKADTTVLLFSGRRDRVIPEPFVITFFNDLRHEGVDVTLIRTDEGHGNAIYTDEGGDAIHSFYSALRDEEKRNSAGRSRR